MALSDAFFAALSDLAERHRTSPLVFLDVWNAESGLNPRAENGGSHAQGLNQMLPSTLSKLGAPADFKSLSGEAQIPWIERLIVGGEKLNGGPFATATRYYHSNFFPRTMVRGQSPSTVVLAENATDPQEAAGYRDNRQLDRSHKGWIDYSDLDAFIEGAKKGNAAVYNAARARLGAVPTSPAAGASSIATRAVVAAAAGAGAGLALAHFYPLERRRRASSPRKAPVMAKESTQGIALAGAVGLVGVVLAAVAAAKGSGGSTTPPKPPPLPPPPPPKQGQWVPTTTVQPGDLVRGSLSTASFASLLPLFPGAQTGLSGWTQILSQTAQTLTGVPNATVLAWAPGDALPVDWPTDDVDRATEYHAQLVYSGTAPVLVSTWPVPLRVWVKEAVGGTLPPPPPPPHAWHRVGINGQTPAGHPIYTAVRAGDLVRLAIDPASLREQALRQNFAPNELGLVQLIQKTWTDSTFPMQGTNIVTHVPGDPLPADWPTDDPAPSTEYHAEFTYGGPVTHTRPANVILWVGTA